MSNEKDFVNYFYRKHHGRVAIGVGYNQNLTEIFPFVFENHAGQSIGIVALGVLPDEKAGVYIYHLGAFITRRGDGSLILADLCKKADNLGIYLRVSAIVTPNGKNPQMGTEQLTRWYKRFGFRGGSGLLRKPKK